jgi:very-short-patch-repair endonuclease
MGAKTAQVWRLASVQHGVVTRKQLLAHGFSSRAIEHRIARGRLHRVWSGVYAVGRPELGRHGRWMAAVLACGEGAALSHADAGALFSLRPVRGGPVHVSVPFPRDPGRPGITVHRRTEFEVTIRHGIPVTTPVCTLVDLATRLSPDDLEAVVNEADKLGLTDPEALRALLPALGRRPGAAKLACILDRRTFRLTDSALERRTLRLVARAGLPPPLTQAWVNGCRVDFWWPDLGLIVEVDGLRYHRTPAQQAHDRRRDQAHAAAGLTVLRFTHAQVMFEPRHVEGTLRAVTRRLGLGRIPVR